MKRSQRIKHNSQMGLGAHHQEDFIGMRKFQERALIQMSEEERIKLEEERVKWMEEEIE